MTKYDPTSTSSLLKRFFELMDQGVITNSDLRGYIRRTEAWNGNPYRNARILPDPLRSPDAFEVTIDRSQTFRTMLDAAGLKDVPEEAVRFFQESRVIHGTPENGYQTYLSRAGWEERTWGLPVPDAHPRTERLRLIGLFTGEIGQISQFCLPDFGMRPATVEQLVAFAGQHPELVKGRRIMAPGSSIYRRNMRGCGDRPFFPVIENRNGGDVGFFLHEGYQRVYDCWFLVYRAIENQD